MAAVEAKLETGRAAARRPSSTRARAARRWPPSRVSGATAMTLQVLWTRALAVLLGLVGLLVHAHPARVPDRPGRRAPPCSRAPASARRTRSAGWRCCTWRPPAAVGADLPVHRQDPVRLHLAAAVVQLRRRRDPGLPVRARLHDRAAGDAPDGRRLPADRARGGRRRSTRVGHDVGNAYALNTAGRDRRLFSLGVRRAAQAGAAEGHLRRGAVRPGAGGGAVLGGARADRAGAARPASPPPVALALLGLVLPRWDLGSFSSGFFRVSIAREYIYRKIHKRDWQTPKLVFYEDGIATTVTVDQWDKIYSMKNNGKVDASNDADMPTQIVVGLLPFLFYNQPHAAQGRRWSATARASPRARSRSTRSQSLEVVELEPAVYRGVALLRQRQPPPAGEPQGHGARRRRAQLPHPAQRQVRRHRQRAVEPVADRRLEPVHARVLPSWSRRASPSTASSASGRSSTRWRPGTSRPSSAPCARSSRTSTCSRPRTGRRTRS